MASEIESVSSAEKNYKMIERVLLANVEEQRRARRWGLFWRFATFFIFLVVLAATLLGDGPAGSPPRRARAGR